ncbi:MAG: hypothetical protein H7318_09790 [Oligoflexus sp.]|nr:hypothetical protein [Oligoflexus sp.]
MFGENLRSTFVSSTKSLIGHPCGSAGSMEALFCALMIDRSFLAPVFNLESISKGFNFVSPGPQHLNQKVDLVMNNSFGFGGINTSMLIARWDGRSHILN